MAPLYRFQLDFPPIFECDSDEGFVEVSVSKQQQPLKVRFAESASVKWVDSKKNYPADVKAQLWYKRKDYNRFRDSCRRIIEWISSRDLLISLGPDTDEEEHFCARGLERYTQDGSMRYAERFHSMKNDLYVLCMTGARPNEIAELMQMHSADSVMEARERARQDAYAAKRYQKEPSTRMSSLMPKVRPIKDQLHDDLTNTKGRRGVDQQPFRPLRQSTPSYFFQQR